MLSKPYLHMFGVADGHGKYGREISRAIKMMFP